jgi:hypothetical protein
MSTFMVFHCLLNLASSTNYEYKPYLIDNYSFEKQVYSTLSYDDTCILIPMLFSLVFHLLFVI